MLWQRTASSPLQEASSRHRVRMADGQLQGGSVTNMTRSGEKNGSSAKVAMSEEHAAYANESQ